MSLKIHDKYETGIVAVGVFVLLGAIQEVYVGNLVQRRDPVWVMVVTFFIALLFFNFARIFSGQKPHESLRSCWKIVLCLNITTCMSWFGFMIALKWLEPAVVSCICFSIGPLITTVMNRFFNSRSAILRGEMWASVTMAIGVIVLTYSSLTGLSSLGKQDISSTQIGLIAALISAFGIMGNTFLSKRMSQLGFNSQSTMAYRFHFLVIIGAAVIYFGGLDADVDLAFSVELVLLSIGTVIVPLYLLQRGIEILEPITVSLLISSMPVITYFLQMLDYRLTPSLVSLTGVFICFASSLAGVLTRYSNSKAIESTEYST